MIVRKTTYVSAVQVRVNCDGDFAVLLRVLTRCVVYVPTWTMQTLNCSTVHYWYSMCLNIQYSTHLWVRLTWKQKFLVHKFQRREAN